MIGALPVAVFAGTLAVCLLAGLAVTAGGTSSGLRKRAHRVARAAQGMAPAQAAAGLPATIRRSEGGTRAAALESLVKRYVPRQSVLRDRLARTGYDVSISAYLAFGFALGGLTVCAMWLMAGLPPVVSVLSGLVCGIGLPHMAVGALARRRTRRFVALLPDAIDLMVRGLRSGLPIGESMAAVSREIGEPVGNEFRRIIEAIRFGRNADEVLADSAKRLDIAEFNFFVISLSIQRETGGNLAETLANLSDIVRRRRQMRLKVKALSGEAKASAMILGSLPFVMFLIVALMNPDYAFQLFADARGLIMVAGGLGSLVVGIAVMAKMVRFEI